MPKFNSIAAPTAAGIAAGGIIGAGASIALGLLA
jgi:hypothetical protein